MNNSDVHKQTIKTLKNKSDLFNSTLPFSDVQKLKLIETKLIFGLCDTVKNLRIRVYIIKENKDINTITLAAVKYHKLYPPLPSNSSFPQLIPAIDRLMYYDLTRYEIDWYLFKLDKSHTLDEEGNLVIT